MDKTNCRVRRCSRQSNRAGYCSRHYAQQLRAEGRILPKHREYDVPQAPICKTRNCGKPSLAKGLCRACYDKGRKAKA